MNKLLAFGNWGREHWGRFDRAIAAADFIGTQLLQSSIRDKATYDGAVSTLVDAARFIQRNFAKPSLVADLAMSSYPSSSYESHQAAFVRELHARMPELRSAGVHAIFYRMIADDPSFDTSNYHGVAERHWAFCVPTGPRSPRMRRLPRW